MRTKVTMEFDARFEKLMQRALLMAQEMEQLALIAPDGQVVDVCEQAVLEKGRKFQAEALGEAVARRIEAAEKKGSQTACESAPAAARKRTAAPRHGN
jgi:hypothetical protein